MTDRLPPELESMDALLKRTLPKEPMDGLTPQQLAGLREKLGAGAPRGESKRRSRKWVFAAILAPVLAASAALFIQGNDASAPRDSYMAADEKAYEGDAAPGLEEDAAADGAAEDVVASAEAEVDEEPADKPATKTPTTVATVKKPPAKIAQTRRQKVLAENANKKNEIAGSGSASLKGMKVGQGKPSAGPKTTAAADSAAAPAPVAPAKPSGGLGLPKPKAQAQASLGKLDGIGTSEKSESKKQKSAKGKADATPTAVASVTTAGPHPREIVTRLVRAAEPKLRACFTTYKKRAGNGAVAKATLTFTVTPEGKVTSAGAIVTDNAFRACLKNEAGRWTFPAAKQKTKVSVRLSFKS